MTARKDDDGLESTAAAPPLGETRTSAPQINVPLGTGTKVGKFVLEERLGAGAMGVVYAARDPELDRRVAIKLIKSRHGSEDLRTRLYREAQALARVAHPNVVVVHEVGEHAGQVFVAMELIKGDTLRAWLAAKQHTTDEILAMLIAAGRGLSAAHAAELVHRDFKPDNVLVGTDGRARVTDFGLARGQGDDSEPRGGSPVTSPLDANLTQTGAMLGTPVYASPEQLAGERVGAASDQFSFCVTAYEALYGQRPFAATTLDEQIDAVTNAKIAPAPGGRSVPARVHRAIVRGLSPRPEDRFPSIDALLAELGAPKRKARGIAIVAALSCVLGGATALGVLATHDAPGPSCADEAAALDTMWSPARAAQLRSKLGTTALADKLVATDANELRRYAAEWSARKRAACTAARDGDAPAQRLVECLEWRREDYVKTVDALVSGPDVIQHLHQLLEPVSSCPSTTRRPVLDARLELQRAITGWAEGNPKTLDALAAGVENIADPILRAETLAVLWEHAFLLRDDLHADDYARRASTIAESSGNERTKIVAAIAQTRMLVRREQLEAAERELDHAAAALAHYGPEVLLEGRLAEARAELLTARGKLADAAGAYEAAFAILGPLDAYTNELALANLYDKLGRTADAAAIRSREDGKKDPYSPVDLTARMNACNTAFNAGELKRMLDTCESLAARRDLGPPLAAGLWQLIALAYQLQPDAANARRAYLELAKLHASMSNADRQANALTAAGRLALDLGEYRVAITYFEQAHTLAQALSGTDPLAAARAGLGRALVGDGQLEKGITELEWALPRLEVMDDPPRDTLARTRLALADALWRRGSANDRERARVTARSAQEMARTQHASVAADTSGLGPHLRAAADRLVATVDGWLAAHR